MSQSTGFFTIIVCSCSSVIPASRSSGRTFSGTIRIVQSFAAPRDQLIDHFSWEPVGRGDRIGREEDPIGVTTVDIRAFAVA